MNSEILIRVSDIVGSPICVSEEDGQIIHDKIAPLIRDNKSLVISFAGVTTLISAFLNVAIGQLYGEFPEEQIRELLTVRDLEPEDLDLLKQVNDNAKNYFRNKPAYDQAWKVEVGDEE
jgi:hypothetical protein